MRKGTKQDRICCHWGGEEWGEEEEVIYIFGLLCVYSTFGGNMKEVGDSGCLLQKGFSWLGPGWKGDLFFTIYLIFYHIPFVLL